MSVSHVLAGCFVRAPLSPAWQSGPGGERARARAQAYRNSVPVPRHWSQKRKYLQGRRGLEKPPFRLPEFIEATGIGEMRQAYQEKARPLGQAHSGAPRPAWLDSLRVSVLATSAQAGSNCRAAGWPLVNHST